MSFESKMKKHIQQVFDTNVAPQSPFAQVETKTTAVKAKKAFSWPKVFIPLGLSVASCAFVIAFALSSGSGKHFSPLDPENTAEENKDNPQGENDIEKNPNDGHGGSDNGGHEGSTGFSSDPTFVESIRPAAAPKHIGVTALDSTIAQSAGISSLRAMDYFLKDRNNKNFVVSPASYLLSVTGIAAVSENFNPELLGLVDPENDIKTLLETWNYIDEETDPVTSIKKTISKMDSGILHQQIAPKFSFDNEKTATFVDKYIATSVASPENYYTKAQEYFADTVGVDTVVPNLHLKTDSVVTYSALNLINNEYNYKKGTDYFATRGQYKTTEVAIYADSSERAKAVKYYSNSQYKAFQVDNMIIVMPSDSNTLDSVDLPDIYSKFINEATVKYAYGYIPTFSLSTYGLDFAPYIKNKLTGYEWLYSKLLKEPFAFDSANMQVIQSSEFSFKAGEEEPVMNTVGSGVETIRLDADRPFYAICVDMDTNFPLFVNKVSDPTIL